MDPDLIEVGIPNRELLANGDSVSAITRLFSYDLRFTKETEMSWKVSRSKETLIPLHPGRPAN